ncbi:MAG: ABC transporter substrate-binding protein [Peptococcaceae bacterium]|nr:ABC transporter substrate-binding protein [Peptococcaceae bacterium]
MNLSRKYLGFLFGSILFLGLLTGCSGTNNVDASSAKLKIGSLPIEDNLVILVAEQNGYFTEENLEVELIPFQSPVESQSAFQSGELDGMVTDMLIAAMLKGSGEKLKVTSLTLGATPQEGRFAIVAAPNSSLEKVSDLKGKTIGISSNSIIEYVTDGLLTEGGVNPNEVQKTVVAKIPVRLEMLLNNQIDAITVPDPYITYTVAQGAKIVAEDTQGKNLSQAVIIMTEKALSEKNDALIRFYKAYAKAVRELNRVPEKYKELLVENANIPESIADEYQIQRYPEPQLPAAQEVEAIFAWLKQKDLLKTEVSYEDFVQKGLY